MSCCEHCSKLSGSTESRNFVSNLIILYFRERHCPASCITFEVFSGYCFIFVAWDFLPKCPQIAAPLSCDSWVLLTKDVFFPILLVLRIVVRDRESGRHCSFKTSVNVHHTLRRRPVPCCQGGILYGVFGSSVHRKYSNFLGKTE